MSDQVNKNIIIDVKSIGLLENDYQKRIKKEKENRLRPNNTRKKFVSVSLSLCLFV